MVAVAQFTFVQSKTALWTFAGSPLILRPLIWRPLVDSPLICSPLICMPAIAEADVESPLIWRPLIWRPLIWSADGGNPLIWRPLIWRPWIGAPVRPSWKRLAFHSEPLGPHTEVCWPDGTTPSHQLCSWFSIALLRSG